MNINNLMSELSALKGACDKITDKECATKCCPFHGDKCICLFEDMGMGMPCEWEIPTEVM